MYERLSQIAQTWGLLLFVLAFALVLFYALNPRSKKKFDDAGKIPLNEGDE
jgi:cytochrome c oxidase cbb3-type subunit 4